MAHVRVRLLGTLPALLKREESSFEVDVPAGSSLADVVRVIGIPDSLVMIFTVNGRVYGREYQPSDGDEIGVLPAVAGG